MSKKTIVVSDETKNDFDVARMGYIAKTRKMINNEDFVNVLIKSFESR